MSYEEINELIKYRDEKMGDYAQQDKITDRKVKNFNIEKLENEYGTMFIRNEFSIDRDRIKFSRAFRRLEHKAQIYSHEKGDHFRTRLTHTLEVSQIARSLARNLNLNEDLVEAIALGHDIGHTPYGHQGERTLDEIMSGDDNLSDKIKFKINYGGFKHNFHSLKILDQLEIKYKDILGMNLTWQVMDGILKHTQVKKEDKCWDIGRFIKNKEFIKDCLDYDFSVTLEGQIVAIADEIAQRQHDVDDGLRDIDLKLNFEKVAKYLIDEFQEIIKQCKKTSSKNSVDNLESFIILTKSIIEEKNIERSELYKVNTLVRNLIDFFIKDVTICSLYELKNNVDKNIIIKEERMLFTSKLICFSTIGEKVNVVIEDYIKGKILNSYNVNRFDGKARHIIRELFKAYYNNPRQMPEYVLRRLSTKINKVCSEIYDIKFKDGLSVKEITFADSKPKHIDNLIKLMKLDIDLKQLYIDDNIFSELISKEYIDEEGMLREEKLECVNDKRKNDLENEESLVKAMLEIQYSYLSAICDYIAGMTDNYASDEFKSLYLLN